MDSSARALSMAFPRCSSLGLRMTLEPPRGCSRSWPRILLYITSKMQRRRSRTSTAAQRGTWPASPSSAKEATSASASWRRSGRSRAAAPTWRSTAPPRHATLGPGSACKSEWASTYSLTTTQKLRCWRPCAWCAADVPRGLRRLRMWPSMQLQSTRLQRPARSLSPAQPQLCCSFLVPRTRRLSSGCAPFLNSGLRCTYLLLRRRQSMPSWRATCNSRSASPSWAAKATWGWTCCGFCGPCKGVAHLWPFIVQRLPRTGTCKKSWRAPLGWTCLSVMKMRSCCFKTK
mmetsp:Transcript_89243/g.148264  ORF Transcript_89243/g.148264 Transcript_89243/m.148264 type:complete len:288 (-) Transcript_89243:80-943(-)